MFKKIKEAFQEPFYQNKAMIQGNYDHIAHNNLTIVYQSSVLGLTITIILALVTPLLIPEWFVTPGHFLIGIVYLGYWLLSKRMLARPIQNLKLIRVTVASYVVISLVLVAYINTIPYPDKPGTLMASMMILSAALFTYSIGEAFTIFTGILILFVFMVLSFKADIVIGEDIFMVLSGYFLAGTVFMLVNRLRYNEFVLKNHYIKLSNYDDLTGILAKKPCEVACEEYLNNRAGAGCALIIIDVDNFKGINDRYGHYQGDLVLKTIGEQLKKVFLDTDVIGRIGGDEFLVLLKDIADPILVERKMHHLIKVIEQSVASQLDVPVGISLGGVLIDGDDVEFAQVYQKADKIMYRNKQSVNDFQVVSFDRVDKISIN